MSVVFSLQKYIVCLVNNFCLYVLHLLSLCVNYLVFIYIIIIQIVSYIICKNATHYFRKCQIFSAKNTENTIEKFLEEVSLATDNEYNLSDSHIKNENFVSLMTIHQSKGLEFDYVYVIGMEENIFPSQQSMFSKKDLRYFSALYKEVMIVTFFIGFLLLSLLNPHRNAE